ncbi:AAA family ATPase [Bifidobacterium rousetti]|uniref:RNA-binding domain-containing protein n=1 Tax=Bifidobacterium rousetti TaxID=2045439 RepID=UPI00123C602F|nr:RNA-binding domain-containing protein [Bifidobacterium rousetti]KAA8816075.1 AAA family ATPase [Bifidobacterium rousetti]
MADHEGQHLEFKLDWNDSAKKTAVAFANSGGGTILVGVDDGGSTVGVDDVDGCMLRVMQSIGNGIRPDLARFTSIRSGERDGRPVVTVEVRPGTDRPYYLSDKGPRPSGVYIRLGAGSIRASEAAILSMIRESSGLSFEESTSVEQGLTFEAARAEFSETGTAFDDGAMCTLGLVSADGGYTNLAWLLSDQCPASIKAAVFEGTDKSVFNAREEFTGSLFSQFRAVAGWLGRFNPTRSTFDATLRRTDSRDYSPAVLREALLNLVAHRDYSVAGPALVSVFDDRMEFVNFGGLPSGMTRDDMMLGTSLQRNPRLAAILYRLGWVEAYGTGVPKIIDDYRDCGVRPEFLVSDNAFKLVLPSHAPGTEAQADAAPIAHGDDMRRGDAAGRRVVLSLTGRPGGASRADIQRATGLAQSSTGKLLRAMIAEGLIEKRGAGRATRYTSAERPPHSRKDGRTEG